MLSFNFNKVIIIVKKLLFKILIIIILANQSCDAKSFFNYSVDLYSKQWACCFEKTLESHIYYRAVIYNALNMDDEQKEIFTNSIRQNSILYKDIVQKIISECENLDDLKKNKASFQEIRTQKRKIKKQINLLNKTIMKEDKYLYNHLTKAQRSKYKLISRLEHRDIIKDCRKKDYHKSNPQMLPFGDLP